MSKRKTDIQRFKTFLKRIRGWKKVRIQDVYDTSMACYGYYRCYEHVGIIESIKINFCYGSNEEGVLNIIFKDGKKFEFEFFYPTYEAENGTVKLYQQSLPFQGLVVTDVKKRWWSRT